MGIANQKGSVMRNAFGMILVFFTTAALVPRGAEDRVGFNKQVLTSEYYCDGINAGDINHDGRPDVIAGPFWYEGPGFERRHAFYPPEPFDLVAGPSASMFTYLYDFDGDGWKDILVLGRVHLHEAYWYENPQEADRYWNKHFAFERVQGESPPFTDVDLDGRPELVALWQERWGLIQPNWEHPTAPWKFKPLTRKGDWNHFYHGTGVGDVNGDGRPDLLLNDGWWEQAPSKEGEWIEHPFRFAEPGGAQMFAYDVNGDGLNDIITSLQGHGWGLAWFEQFREGNQTSFRKHLIMGDRSQESRFKVAFSQIHALDLADVNGDSLMDIVTGKRRWAHGPNGDVEPGGPPVVYWFQLVRDRPGQARFIPHLIDDWSGVGVQVVAQDVNGDSRVDVLTAGKLGSFVFLSE